MEPKTESPKTAPKVRLRAELAGLGQLGSRQGGRAATAARAKCAELFAECLRDNGGHDESDADENLVAIFERGPDAVRCALAFQRALGELDAPERLKVRIAIHSDRAERNGPSPSPGRAAADQAVDLADVVLDIADAGQILLTQSAFDEAREEVSSAPDGSALEWLAHGAFLLDRAEEPIGVFEVGVRGGAALERPKESEKAKSAVSLIDEPTLGWRPAVGLRVPGRDGWLLERKLGEGGFGEVWVAREEQSGEQRAFKFCFRAERLRALKREMTLFRLITESLGERPDIARLHGVQLHEAPYYLEFEYTEGGDLAAWAERRGGIGKVPLAERLEIVAQVAEALDAANSIGILHKDVKPTNVLIDTAGGGAVQPKLTDFGIGQLLERDRLKAMGVEGSGFTTAPSTARNDPSSGSGTRIYFAPELLAGKPPSVQSDVYALGILLYQVVVGDLARPLGHGWEREIEDELLREDIGACADVEPGRRPRSAGELADRIRSLDERRREREKAAETQRVADLAHRRRRQFTVATVMGITLTVVVGLFAAREAKRAATEADLRTEAELAASRAENNYQLARQAVDDSFTQISESKLLNDPQLKPLRRQLMESALGYYESFLAQGAGDSSIRGDHARTYFAVATIQLELVSPEWIDSMSAGHDILEQLLDAEADLAAYGSFAGGSWKATAGQDGSFTEGLSLRPADSYRIYARAIELLERLVKRFPETKGFRSDLAIVCHGMGHLLESNPAASFQSHQRALELFERLHAEDPDVGDYWYGVAISLNRLGQMLTESNKDPRRHTDERQEEAIRYDELCRATYESLLSAFPETVAYREQFAGQCRNHGLHLMNAGRPHEAIEKFSDAARIYGRLRQEYPTIPGYEILYPRFLALRAAALLGSGETAAGTRELEVALSLMTDHHIVGRTAWYLFMWDIDPERVIQYAERAIELDPDFGNQWRMLGAARYRLGDFAAAVEALTHAMTLAPGRDSRAAFFLAMAQWKLGNRDQAQSWRDQAIEWMTADSPDDPDLLLFLSESAELFQSEER